jgi:hydroxycarboxylate dehydrogenase B
MRMRRVGAGPLTDFVTAIFAAAGSSKDEPRILAEHLVEANLLGHDSHGVIRVAKYLAWLAAGEVLANRHAEVVIDRGPLLVVDGGFGYGQVIARETMTLLAERCRSCGLAAVGIRNTGHLGRIGAWPEQLARAGLVSVHFVNTSGYGILVAPHGGSDRRLSANPIAAGAPGPDGRPLVLDIATSAIAEGKLQVARNKGETVPPGAILDGAGRPTVAPEAFYAQPPGAILPFGGHKGSGLSFFCEILAGSLTGGLSSHPQNPTAKRLVNNMLSIAFDPGAFDATDGFGADIARLSAWVKASPPSAPGAEVLLPGEIEARTRMERERQGVPLDDETWRQLSGAAMGRGIIVPADLGETI